MASHFAPKLSKMRKGVSTQGWERQESGNSGTHKASCAPQVDCCVERSHLPASEASGVRDKAIWSPFDSSDCNCTIWPRNCWQPLFEAAVIQLSQCRDRDRAIPWNSPPSRIYPHRSLVLIVNLAVWGGQPQTPVATEQEHLPAPLPGTGGEDGHLQRNSTAEYGSV